MQKSVHINVVHASKRLEWAQANRDQDWSRIIFTDEMSVQRGLVRRTWTTRRKGEATLRQHIAPTFRSGRQSIMVWGAVSRSKKWPLVLLPPGSVSGQVYADEVLAKHLGPMARELRRRIWQPALVVEDNAPIHNGRIATQKREQLHLARLPHPPSSPDLNPIEHLWAWVKWVVAKRIPRANTQEQLWVHVQEAWDEIPMEAVQALIDSMERRRLAVLKARGYYTRY
jgi:hypothetical protein